MDGIRILVVEDDIFISQDIQECLKAMDYSLAGVAYDAKEALALLPECRPDLVLLDIHLGDEADGIAVATVIRDTYQLPFIFLTSFATQSVLDRAKRTRPMGYIVKPFQEKDLFAAIEIALYNFSQRWQPPHWEVDYINQLLSTDFTAKEVAVLQDIFEGKTNRQLCELHHVSINTIKTHVKRIYDKLDVHSRSEAIASLRRKLAR
ncbi:MAG: response regulator transcription factor [Bacteroidota bacterium]